VKHQPVETDEVVELTPEEIAELDDRDDAVERGEFVDGDEVLRRLRSCYYVEADESMNSVVMSPAEFSYELTREQEDALEESIEQIARGEFVTAKALFDELREIREQASRGCSPSEA